MGKLLSKIFGNKEMRILMLGLDAAGKTSKKKIQIKKKLLINFFFVISSYFIQTKTRPISDHNTDSGI